MLFALMLLAADPAVSGPAQGAPVTFSPRPDAAPQADQAVPLDWGGPAARTPGADPAVQRFDPAAGLFDGDAAMCVIVPGQPAPPCAASQTREISLGRDILTASNENPDSTCQTVEDVRLGPNGRPQRVFATICGDDAEAWSFRQRQTPGSQSNPSRSTNRAVGPNEVASTRNPTQR